LELVNTRLRGQIGEAQKDARGVCVDLTCAPSESRNQTALRITKVATGVAQ